MSATSPIGASRIFDMDNTDVVSIQPQGQRVITDTQQEAAYRAIRDAILDGFLQTDAPLSVRALSEALHVGTMPARTAVQRLIAERALEFTSSRKIRAS